ncbi:hypothetical protein F2P81_000034 [Scophthalmus maximus]|uniref:Uncharacterized protein n=1 Tax=Scophthalmus maximus TaxID=52904 RepID=A0A6A4TUP8_SCOMX|nr:hypothetical protein F2P81_000034 [Scophthalmus maximus]
MLSGSSEIWLVSVRADTELLRFIRCVCAVRCALCCCSLRTAPVAPPPGIGTLRVCDTGTRIQPTEKRSAGRSRWRGCRCRCLSPGQGAPAPTLPPEGEELSARSSIFPGSLPAPRRAPVLFISAAPARLRCGVTGIYAELSTRRLFHLSRANWLRSTDVGDGVAFKSVAHQTTEGKKKLLKWREKWKNTSCGALLEAAGGGCGDTERLRQTIDPLVRRPSDVSCEGRREAALSVLPLWNLSQGNVRR